MPIKNPPEPKVDTPPDNPPPELKHKPPQVYVGLKVQSAHLTHCLHMGQFDICVSEDGQELQIWKGEVLLKIFK